MLDFHKIINTEEKRRGVEALGSEMVAKLTYYERWMSAFTPEDDVWPGRFSILSVRTSPGIAPRVSLYLRPVEFEVSPQAIAGRTDDDGDELVA